MEVAGFGPPPGRLGVREPRAVALDGELAGFEQAAPCLLQVRLLVERVGVAERGGLVPAAEFEVLPLGVELVRAFAAGDEEEREDEKGERAGGEHRGESRWREVRESRRERASRHDDAKRARMGAAAFTERI